ncbi:TetR/AcrR family transcriptional regulator [Streptomyces sp. NRRL F-5123]|uniref:TetR/AcrR family transcriptional regulator n=1 Tax=Streptomyces sp. NRRL F-5123 TaxID=1463856 RepID=UPI00099D919C|nr:TetR/AcrR family transcriptional regulator [Streptomyces sp. NRRL F-5123]
MARTKGDHESRRRDVSEAVWQVMAERGFSGLTLRAVAARLGASTGLLTHYFPSKDALVVYALDLLEERTASRRRGERGHGLAGLRDALLDVLPLTAEATDSNRVWVSSWGAALADPALTAGHAGRYARGRARLAERVVQAQQAGELRPGDPDRIAAAAHAFVLGLVVQALLDPAAFPPERQIALVDDHLAALAPPAGQARRRGGTGGAPGAHQATGSDSTP